MEDTFQEYAFFFSTFLYFSISHILRGKGHQIQRLMNI